MHNNSRLEAPRWMRYVLQIAAVYNLIWGAIIIVAPLLLFRWAGMEDPRYPQIWQCVGMIVGVYGIGYWLAAYDPYRHWPVVLVGFLGKILGPIGFLQAALAGDLPWAWGATIVTNDLIWWVPFAAILYSSFRVNTDTSKGAPPHSFERAIHRIRSQRNASLSQLSSVSPTLVVFLRHGGCTFCRETLADLRTHRREIEATGTAIAVVHMGGPMEGTLMLERYGLDGIHRFSDPRCELYSAFGVGRGTLNQLLSTRVIKRGFQAFLRGHGIGMLHGDGFRMSGAFLLQNGRIIKSHMSEDASDIPSFVDLLPASQKPLQAAKKDGSIVSSGMQ